MPDFCAADGCANIRTLETRTLGITFHLFPKSRERRIKWELALRRKNFAASARTLLCSDHFRSEDFDRLGQTVRLRDGVVPTLFNFPAHLQRSVATRSTTTSKRARDNLAMDLIPDVSVATRGTTTSKRARDNLAMDLIPDVSVATRSTTASKRAGDNLAMDLIPDVKRQGATGERRLSPQRQPTDHLYALPACPKAIKAKLEEASATVRKLQQEKSNALKRENRARNNMQAVLEELKEKNLIIEKLKVKLDCYSDFPVHLLSRHGVEFTKAQRDFALTLHLHGPKAYHYLRDTLHIHLPHPSSLQRWLE